MLGGRRQRARKRRKVPRLVQEELAFPRRPGGKRKGAGRKARHGKAGISHHGREAFLERSPLLVTWKLSKGLPTLRRWTVLRVLEPCLAAACRRELEREAGFRVLHFSFQSNHVHLIVEADTHLAASRGLQGLGVRFARALNAHWKRRGRVFADRYHAQRIQSRRAMRNVLHNAKKHGYRLLRWDPFSSALEFDGWGGGPIERRLVPDVALPHHGPRVLPPRGWLATVGWKLYGAIALEEAPA